MKRRHFIRNTVLGTLGASFARPMGAGAVTTASSLNKSDPGPVLIKGTADSLRVAPADADVLSLVSSFSSRKLFFGGCVAGKSGQGNFRSTHLLLSISNLPAYLQFLASPGAIVGSGMCIGNNLCFNYKQTTFELEALLPDAFQKRLANAQNGLRADGSPMIYAHEALTYEPSTKVLTDPFHAFAGVVAALKRINTPTTYGQLAEGSLDIPAYHLLSSARDQADLNTYLGRTVTDSGEALKIVAAFLQNLSLNSQVNTTQDVQTLCATRMLLSAMQLALGCNSFRVAGNFVRLRALFTADITDGTIWHAMFQTAEVPPDGKPKAATMAVAGGCRFKTFLTMQEFQKVGKVKANKSFKVYA
ncbi:MAG: hypothetical protein P4L99_30060 [Chthoniobacter sp.]|nr:hypothetical protein [Chthoniobacter sp.]